MVRIYVLCCLAVGVLISADTQAQHRKKKEHHDSLKTVSLFMQICNNYKTLPLQANVKIVQQANIITTREDTITLEASFYLQNNASYIRLGEIEQLVNDSLMTLVNHRVKRILVYKNGSTVANRLDNYIGVQLQDSMLQEVFKTFSVAAFHIKDTPAIRLDSRRVLVRTLNPKETVEIKYNPANMQPYEVMQIKREIIKINQALFNTLSQDHAFAGKTFEQDNEFYAVKELSTLFIYERIEHKNENTPVAVGDRVLKDKEGAFIAATGFEDYVLRIMN